MLLPGSGDGVRAVGVRSLVRVGVVGAGGFASFVILKRLNTDLRQRGVEERRRVA